MLPSHWNLWKTLLFWQHENKLPEYYASFEDDASCAADALNIVSQTI
jgi:hypothetical protein